MIHVRFFILLHVAFLFLSILSVLSRVFNYNYRFVFFFRLVELFVLFLFKGIYSIYVTSLLPTTRIIPSFLRFVPFDETQRESENEAEEQEIQVEKASNMHE